ncbi:hypothetical protein ASD15_05715 [Massilia sp. Root351]|jgi:mannose/cellobiose epimerase-like protein (N-acyl-D-glucosamine 2-epimerase family)|uniref:DUF6624 domain-containing protein n=1 Tax=Massilia sp. Root351 TaxID=1736522 RepID=UPI00070CC5F2|nr:DUF6624 domain-containing protein [Massilia sp. Root351]KQV84677.1 hypothetical protein ASD15_05715 [Massilia sp. Root351]
MRFALAIMLFFHARAYAAIDCSALETRLSDMASADQRVRREHQQLSADPNRTPLQQEDLDQRWHRIDGANTAELKAILAACGWPPGEQASHLAWLLAQHADKDRALQRTARNLLESAVKKGVAAPRDLAYLADRIATAQGRPQEYGTQFTMPDRCTLTMLPVDSIDQVNRRRRTLGMQSIEEYEAEGRKRLIPADCPAPE